VPLVVVVLIALVAGTYWLGVVVADSFRRVAVVVVVVVGVVLAGFVVVVRHWPYSAYYTYYSVGSPVNWVDNPAKVLDSCGNLVKVVHSKLTVGLGIVPGVGEGTAPGVLGVLW